MNNIIKEATDISSINKHVTTHTLRHTHISTLAQLGINLKAIQDRVGHSDYKTTLEIYTHVTDQMAKDMMNKLERIWGWDQLIYIVMKVVIYKTMLQILWS